MLGLFVRRRSTIQLYTERPFLAFVSSECKAGRRTRRSLSNPKTPKDIAYDVQKVLVAIGLCVSSSSKVEVKFILMLSQFRLSKRLTLEGARAFVRS